MTTFKDFLKGDSYKEIQQRCKLFIEKSDGLPLYRGYGGPITAIFSGTREVPIRKDRKPRDSSQYVHGLLDAYFQRKFGVKVRSEGLFTTGDRELTERYGRPHWVFPVGNFKFVWGMYKGDAVADTLWWTRRIQEMMQVRKAEEGDSVTDMVLQGIDWYTDDLPKAIKSGAEIAILADSAFIVPYDSKTPYEKIIGG